jgi:CHAD domain-containing protein
MPRGQPQARGHAPESTVTAALRQSIQNLQGLLDTALNGLPPAITPDAVHRTRTAARRLRALLCAFKRSLQRSAFRHYAAALQELAHDLDTLREADVTQHILANLSRDYRGLSRVKLDGLKSEFVQSRTRAAGDLQSAMATKRWPARLVKLRDAASDRALVVATHESMRSMTQRVLTRRRRRLRAALRYRGQGPRRLHKIRLKVKTLRYLLEQCESSGCDAVRAEVKQLRELQDCLGELHDAWCLGRALRRYRRHHRRATTELSTDIETRRAELFHRFRKHRKALRRLWRAARNATVTRQDT